MPSSYPLDTTGLSPGNLVSNEVHTLTEINSAPYRILIPVFAPFYLDNFVLTHEDAVGVTTTLIEDSDFYLCLPYVGATRSTGKTVYGGITINNRFINGTLRVTYQTIGGDWTADAAFVREKLIEKVYNPRLTLWDMVTDKQNLFPPTVHAQPADTIFGQQQLINAINGITTQIAANALAPSNNPLSAVLHPGRTDNPHGTTKDQVGLGLVENFPVATAAEVASSANVDKYVLVKHLASFQGGGGAATKASIGLGNVDNTSDVNKPVSTSQQAAITNARNDAVNTASADATAKAATSQAAAIAAAAIDATSKANSAENAARAASTPIGHTGAGGNAHALATTTTAGFMSAADKVKLDGLQSQIDTLTAALAGKADIGHTHTVSQITDYSPGNAAAGLGLSVVRNRNTFYPFNQDIVNNFGDMLISVYAGVGENQSFTIMLGETMAGYFGVTTPGTYVQGSAFAFIPAGATFRIETYGGLSNMNVTTWTAT